MCTRILFCSKIWNIHLRNNTACVRACARVCVIACSCMFDMSPPRIAHVTLPPVRRKWRVLYDSNAAVTTEQAVIL